MIEIQFILIINCMYQKSLNVKINCSGTKVFDVKNKKKILRKK